MSLFASFTREIPHGIAEEGLEFVACYVAEHILFVSLAVPHLAEYLSVGGEDSLDGIVGAVGVVGRLHGSLACGGVSILERHLPVGEELLRHGFADDELTLTVADGDTMQVASAHAVQPRTAAAIGRHHGSYHLRDMAVDIIAEERGRVGRYHAEFAVGQQAALDEGLEAVADTEDESPAVNQRGDSRCHLPIVDDIGNELTAAVGLIACGEAAREHQDMAAVDMRRHLINGVEHILRREVAEDSRLHLCARCPPCLRTVVVAVRTREDGDIDNGSRG